MLIIYVFTNILAFLVEGMRGDIQPRATKTCRCGHVVDEDGIVNRVVGGSVVSEKGHPYLAYVDADGMICGGSIIGNNHILTAAHCLNEASVNHVNVVLGLHDSFDWGTRFKKYEAKGIVVHEEYQESSLGLINDVALITVDNIEFNDYVQPICLPFNIDLNNYKAAVVMGWGDTSYEGYSTRYPQQVLLSVLSKEQCHKSLWEKDLTSLSKWDDKILCAYKRDSDACQGDSGGPLIIKNDDSKVFLIGVVSFGDGCGDSFGVPGMYARVSNYLPWLKKHLRNDICSVYT